MCACRFHGKPPKTEDRKYSEKKNINAIIQELVKIPEFWILNFLSTRTNRYEDNKKNNEKKSGKIIITIGIKYLKKESYSSGNIIQWNPTKK